MSFFRSKKMEKKNMETKEEGIRRRRREKFQSIARQIGSSMKRTEKEELTEEKLRKFFREQDVNGDGHLDRTELKEAFKRLGSKAPAWRASRALHYNDLDLDGLIDHEHEIEHLVSYAIKFGYNYI